MLRTRGKTLRYAFVLMVGCALTPVSGWAQMQRQDEAYTRLIKEHLQDPRISTELVDHLPASDRVPTPLKFNGRIVGQPGELTYAKDINRYMQAIDQASDRVLTWNIGKTEEGRDMIVVAIADEATIRDLQRYRGMLKQLTDPRTTTEEQARQLIQTAKPMYWLTSGMHSTETGGPEMLMELAYRLAVEETPFIQNIRNNIITLITPVIEVDGREKQVDTYYFNKNRTQGRQNLPLMYWGKYVAHDNNRDGMGQFLALTKNVTRFFNEWTPTIMHDLHEAQTYLYSSTGTGPYNEQLDAITIDEWWLFAKNDVMEMTKRGVPGVWTYGFYDGWVPNYMFFIAHSHNAIGRFYEVASYGPENRVQGGGGAMSREWYRPNPALPTIQWGPRNSVNISQSAVLLSLQYTARNKDTWLENYWLKNKRSVDKGKNGPTHAWLIPATQRRKADAATAVNDLRRQGLEIHTANTAFKAGNLDVKQGDYIVRADQPYRTLADMYFSLQNYAIGNPSPYDDTGWTFQLMRNLNITPVTDKAVLAQPMTLIAADVKAPGGIEGSGPVVVVEHTSDMNIVTFRFKHPTVKMAAAEEDFDMNGKRFRAGAIIIPNAPRSTIEPTLRDLGLSGFAVAAAPAVRVHDLDVPRIGYVHAWQNTQNEGWVRAALETYGIPFTYFADQKLREGNLRAKYDVIIFPHVGGSAESQVNGIAKTNDIPLPYQKTDKTPNLGSPDASPDIRGGMGWEGLMELHKFVRDGGTLITEGSTATIFPEYKLTPGITVEQGQGLFARGSIMRGVITDRTSPLMYGYEGTQLPVYFSQAPILNAGGGGGGGFGEGGRGASVSQNTSPMASPLRLSPWDSVTTGSTQAGAGRGGRGGGGGGGGGRGGFGGTQVSSDPTRPRVVMSFPTNDADMLLSGTLNNGQILSGRAQVIDAPVGNGHVVMFAIRPFWRWQTQGTFPIGFNAIMNWNDLNAGRPAPASSATGSGR
jgi:hypothetical protein